MSRRRGIYALREWKEYRSMGIEHGSPGAQPVTVKKLAVAVVIRAIRRTAALFVFIHVLSLMDCMKPCPESSLEFVGMLGQH